MFLSLRSHKLIVECLEKRIAELERERDFYRLRWTERQGAPLSPDRPVETQHFASLRDAPFDAAWTPDDRDLFEAWKLANVANGEDAFDVWRRQHGTQAPLMALTV